MDIILSNKLSSSIPQPLQYRHRTSNVFFFSFGFDNDEFCERINIQIEGEKNTSTSSRHDVAFRIIFLSFLYFSLLFRSSSFYASLNFAPVRLLFLVGNLFFLPRVFHFSNYNLTKGLENRGVDASCVFSPPNELIWKFLQIVCTFVDGVVSRESTKYLVK